MRTGLAATLVAAVAVGAGGVRSGTRGVDPARAAADYASLGVVAVGHDLYLGDQHLVWDDAIKAIYYTSAGVVVRSGASSQTSDGRSTYTLVSPTGERSAITAAMSGRIPGFEPDSTRFAYAAPTDRPDAWDVVVHDAATDTELARVRVTGAAYGGWVAPPASIDGDVAWVHLEGGWTEVDWRTGAVRAVPDTADTYEVQDGSYAVQRGHVWEVRAVADGSTIGEVDLPRGWYGFFSPDGGALRAFPDGARVDEPASAWAYDVASGTSFEHVGVGYEVGWTPDGHLLVRDGDRVSVCELLTDRCEPRPFDVGDAPVKLGGAAYES